MAPPTAMEVLLLLLILTGLCSADKARPSRRKPSSRFVPPPPGPPLDIVELITDPVPSTAGPVPAPAADCMPFAAVPGQVGRMVASEAPATCSFPDGSVGVSASRTPPPPPATGPPLPARAPLPPLPLPAGAGKHLAAAVRKLDAMVRLERRMRDAPPLASGSPEQLQSLHFLSDAETQHQGRRALRDLMVVRLASNSSDVAATTTTATTKRRESGRRRMRVMVRKKMVREERVPGCELEPEISCDKESKYRTADGSCNNLKTPSLGRSGTGLHRLMNSTYADGIFSPRLLDVRGAPLPSARVLSATLLSTASNPDGRLALSLPVFAEFLSHDLQQTGVFRLAGDRPLDCCGADAHPQCLPIAVSADDPVFGASGRRCLSMARSLPALERRCQPRPASPLSRQTAFLDGSALYGATEADTRRLREMDGGRLRSNGGLLPPRASSDDASREATEDTDDASKEVTKDTDDIVIIDESKGRQQRSAFGGPTAGFMPRGLFWEQPFGQRFGGPPPPQFGGSDGPFDGLSVGPALVGGPFNRLTNFQNHQDFPGFGGGLRETQFQHGDRRAPATLGGVSQSHISFSNGFPGAPIRIQHPISSQPNGQTLDAFDVNRLANGGHDRKKRPIQATDKLSSSSRHNRPSSHYEPPKGHEAPRERISYDPPHKSYAPPKPRFTRTRSQNFPGPDEESDRTGSDDRSEADSSPFQNDYLGRIIELKPRRIGGLNGKSSGLIPASQPLSFFPERASEDEVEVIFPGRTLADDRAAGAISSRLQAPNHPRPTSGVSADLTSLADAEGVDLEDHVEIIQAPGNSGPTIGKSADLTSLTDVEGLNLEDHVEIIQASGNSGPTIGKSADLTSLTDVEGLNLEDHVEIIQASGNPRPISGVSADLISLTDVKGLDLEDQVEIIGDSIFGTASNTSPSLATDQSCDAGCRDCTCFDAGNRRANEQLHGALLHTVWLREHNRVAAQLGSSHPDWDDERLFQETRRVVVAELQHITYNEFLPATLGYEYAAKRGLLPLSIGFSPLYNASADPRTAVEFSTAAFRASHSKLQAMLRLVSRSGRVDTLPLSDGSFEPSALVERDFFVRLARGMIDQPAEGTDASFASAVHGELFDGGDLPALTVQRGRDQGLPTYPSAVRLCHGTTLASWDDYSTLMEPEAVEALRASYADPADVDLYMGGVMERHAAGADLGPTFQCLVGDMFYRLRVGDRFFYDNPGQAGSFEERQLDELRKASMARLLCDNVGGDFDGVQPMAMLRADETENPIVSCFSQALPKVDLGVF